MALSTPASATHQERCGIKPSRGAKTFAEEHIFVPKMNGAEDGGWLVGTSLDYAAKVTRLNVLDAQNISDGPIAVFELPYALPLGFHGAWLKG